MPLRRSLAAAAAATLLAVPLTACGSDYNTNRVNNNATGTYDKSSSVDVVAATIVSSGPDEGTFIANLSNNNQVEPASLVSLTGADGVTLEAADFEPVELAPGQYANLADGGLGIKVYGDFVAGDVVSMEFTFGGADPVTLGVPVVLECDEYAGLDPDVPGTEPVALSPTDEAIYSCEQLDADDSVEGE